VRKWLAAAALGVALLPAAAGAQCPMCRTALQTPQGAALAAGFRHGILLLLAAPFLSIGCVAWLVVRSQRRGPRGPNVPQPPPGG
jgi:hypothetical protein